MIVDSMTYEEIISEFKKDWGNYFPNVLPRFRMIASIGDICLKKPRIMFLYSLNQ